MARFTQPDVGNTKRIGSPVNSIKNLIRKFNRQRRARLLAAALEAA